MAYPIRVYHAKDKEFTGVGLCGDLFPISCEFEEVGNGISQITMVHPVDEYGKYRYLQTDNVLSAFVPVRAITKTTNPDTSKHADQDYDSLLRSWNRRQQYFRIQSVEPSSNRTVTVKAVHIFYDLSFYVYKNSFPRDNSNVKAKNLIMELSNWTSYIGNKMPFEFITDAENGEYHVDSYLDRDAASIVLDPEIGLCGVMGANIVRDNFDVFIMHNVGFFRGNTIEYDKNLSYVSMNTDMSNVATRIRPIGRTKEDEPLYLEENEGCVDSPLKANYSFDRVVTLTVNDAVVSDEMSIAQARELMQSEAQKQFDQGVDKPNVSIRVEYSRISDDVKYSQFMELEKLFLYDYVHVLYPALGIDQVLTITRIIYDVVHGKMITIEIGHLEDLAPTIQGWQISGGIQSSKIVVKKTNDKPQEEFDITKFLQSGKIVSDFYDPGDTHLNVSYPKDFDSIPNICLTIESGSGLSGYSCYVHDITKTGFKICVHNDNESATDFEIQWIASMKG